jgi:PAS domain S-box-containing protein
MRLGSLWPILAIATCSLLLVGGIISLVTRVAMERQTQSWSEKFLRSLATSRALLIGQQCASMHDLARQTASRLMIRDQLELYQHGTLAQAALIATCVDDLGAVRSANAAIGGIILLDHDLRILATIGQVPEAPLADLGSGQQALHAMLQDGAVVLRALAPIRAVNGEVIGQEALFFRLDDMIASNQEDLGFGPGLERRMAAMINGHPFWLGPPAHAMAEADATAMAAQLAHPSAAITLVQLPDGSLAGVQVGIPEAALVIVLDLDRTTMEGFRSRDMGLVTVVLLVLVTLSSGIMLVVLLPMARRMARQASDLQRSEEFNRSITASSPDGILVLDRIGNILSINESGLRMLHGAHADTLVGLPWMSMWPLGDASREQALLALQTAAGRGLGRFRATTAPSTGTLRHWDVAVAPILDAHGGVDRLLSVFRDITEQQEAELAIAAIALRLQTVAAATNDAIWDWDITVGTVWWNDGVCTLFGYQRAEVGDDPAWWRAQLHADDRERVLSALDLHLAGGEAAWRCEYRFRCADGSYRPVLDRGQVIRDGDGRALRLVAAMFDLSERHQILAIEHRRSRQAALRADVSAAFVATGALRPMLQICAQALVQHLDVAFARIWILDDAHTTLLLEASAGMYTHLDGAHGRVPVGRFKIGLIAEQRLPHLTNAVLGDARVPEQEWVAREGLVAFAGYPLLAGGQLMGVMGMFSRHPMQADTFEALAAIADIIALGVRRVQVERELAVQAEALRRTNAELEQFTYVASHDLQEPLRTIANRLDMIGRRHGEVLDDKGRRHLEQTSQAAVRLQALVRDLLALSLAGQQGAGELELVPAQEVFDETISGLQAIIAESGATVEAHALPEVRYNRRHLGQLLQNLIGNALKYRGAQPPLVRVSARRDGAFWVWSCQDNGIGIESCYFERIFEVFQRLHGREEYPGTGIGLALCKKIVTAHGGTVWLESRVGEGTTFHFTIPA